MHETNSAHQTAGCTGEMLSCQCHSLLSGAIPLALATGRVILTDESTQAMRVQHLEPCRTGADQALGFKQRHYTAHPFRVGLHAAGHKGSVEAGWAGDILAPVEQKLDNPIVRPNCGHLHEPHVTGAQPSRQ
jgi:hypothetical protein